jgi:CIC family chloride channel protein
VLALLAAFKILSTTFSFVSGTPGGMFAPTLFIGAMVGGAVGGIEHHFFPWLTGSVGAYALVGMGVFFAGFLRAPFTSVFMILEVSGNYSIIVPVMISNTIAYLISRRFQATPLFDVLSRQDGMDLPSMEEQREATTLRVEDAMRPYAGPLFRDEDRVAEALRRAEDSPADFYLLPGANGAWRGFGKQALQKIVNEGNGAMPLGIAITDQPLPWVHPDQPLEVALREIQNLPLLPVVHRADFRKLEGVVSLADILGAYGAARPAKRQM